MESDINRLRSGHCLREAGAGGSNPLTPTSVSAPSRALPPHKGQCSVGSMNQCAENGAGTPPIPGPGEALIPLTQGRFALVDEFDAAWLSQWKWCASITAGGRYVYAARRGREDGKFRLIYMHRAILGAPRGLDVDHISGDTLDNRRRNLRSAKRGENNSNTPVLARGRSGYRGVSKNSRGLCWRAEIGNHGNKLLIGASFPTPEAAARAYNEAAARIYGPFARLNPVPEPGA